MFQNNSLLAQLKQQLQKETPRIQGMVKAHEKGYGFLVLDNKKSYFIPVAQMRKLLNGDIVEGTIQINGDKEQFEPEKVIESAVNQFVGRVECQTKQLVVYAKYHHIIHPIKCQVSPHIQETLATGDWVSAKLVARPLQNGQTAFLAEITDFIATANDPLAPWLTTLSHYQLEVSAPILDIDLQLSEQEQYLRQDLCNLPFFSIDNKETQDIDDAICVEQNEAGQFVLTVAIADPTAYLSQQQDLDKVASQRLFTTYLPEFNVPMLPPEMSDDHCSLKLNEKRAAVICRVTIDEQGNPVSQADFSTAWISSKAKLDYTAVSDYLEGNQSCQPDNQIIDKQLHLLHQLCLCRIEWRKINSLLFKDREEYRFILDSQRQVIDIVQDNRRIGHQMIEEAMILVNQALAYYLQQHIGMAVFNVHAGFDSKHLDMIVKLLNKYDITEFDKIRLATFEGYKALRKQIADKPYIESRILRYQTAADFVLEAAPHYGLGLALYTTWTSPLRKYSDMLNHRLLKGIIYKQPVIKPCESVLKGINERRKRLRLAERELAKYLYSQYLKDRLGQGFTAEVFDINKGGAKVRLCEIGAVAFLPMSLIHQERSAVESIPEDGLMKINQLEAFRIADKINVTLHEVKMDNNAIIVKYQAAAPMPVIPE
ncbi:exoribonuclease II [Utexia brackfieldae]|uniref:exoribonuclease II n=1 Tax=Utexia brackfieldae TaxID=3074108 RepID=UPI00370DD346